MKRAEPLIWIRPLYFSRKLQLLNVAATARRPSLEMFTFFRRVTSTVSVRRVVELCLKRDVNGDPQRLELEARLAALSKNIETKVAEAFLTFQEVIQLNPDHVASRQGMLILAMFRGQRPEVVEQVSVLKRLTPNENVEVRGGLDFGEFCTDSSFDFSQGT